MINYESNAEKPLPARSDSPYETNLLSESEIETLRQENMQYKEREKSLLARISQLEQLNTRKSTNPYY